MRAIPLVVIALSVTACAARNTSPVNGEAARPIHNTSILSAEEMPTGSLVSVLDAIRSLRPNFLSRGAFGPLTTPVYLDLIRFGDAERLATIPAAHVHEVRYLNAIDATTHFGSGHSMGAILVTTRPGR